MKKIHEFGIIGLGKFGLQLGRTLADMGQTCIGMDISPQRAQLAKDILAQTYEADATDKNALLQLRFQALDTVVVSVGSSLEATILAILNLQELGIKNIIAKAASPLHAKVLGRMGAIRIVQPEIDAATRLAYSLENPGLIDLLPIGRGVMLQKADIKKWAGKTLKNLDLRNVSNVLVAAVRPRGQSAYRFVPDPDRVLETGDTLLIIGYRDAVEKIVGRT